MTTLRKLAKKAKAINLQELALQVAKANEVLISSKIVSQLEIGENAEGKEVGRYTSTSYAAEKTRTSEASFGVVDLKLSGKLHEKLTAKIANSQFLVNSLVSYSKYQVKRYGKNIYGLKKENQEFVSENNSKEIVRRYKTLLGL